MTETAATPSQRKPPVGVPAFQPPAPPIAAETAAALTGPTTETPIVADRRPPYRPQGPDGEPKMSLFEKARSAAGIRTGTSSADGPTAKPPAAFIDKEVAIEAAGAVAGLLVLAGVLAVKWRYRGERKLRQPTDKQVEGVAKPVAEILMRRAGISRWGKDLLAGLAAAGTFGAYMNEGPLTLPNSPDTGEIPNPGDLA